MNEHTKDILKVIDMAATQECDSVKALLRVIARFAERYCNAEAKLPYYINLLDEAGANENTHSRILAKLLQYKTPDGRFEILESWLRYIAKKCGTFGDLRITKPVITQEIERIDLWIRDEGYAVIVENKIYWATDQQEQLSRYIDITKSYGFKEDRIYVVYLSPVYDKQPDGQTWGAYSERFAKRFAHLSFRDDLLPWLAGDVLPNVRTKDRLLSAALEQYIDHLKGMFLLRIINQQMNMELQDLLKEEWGLNGAPQENIAKLQAKQDEMSRINNQAELLKKGFEQEIFREWQTSVKAKYPYCTQVEMLGVGLIVPFGETTLRVVISIDSGQLYCQVDMQHLNCVALPPEVLEKTGHLLPTKDGDHTIWKYLPRYAYNDVYLLFLEVMEKLTGR